MAAKEKKNIGVPEPTIRRMPLYLHLLKGLETEGQLNISAPQIAKQLKIDSTQIVKDLSYTGVVGKTRVGYDIVELIAALEDFLGFNRENEAFLIGAGKLGSALLGYPGFDEYGFKIVAAFDVDESIVNTEIDGVTVLDVSRFKDLTDRLHITIGIITTPANTAQRVADLMIECGITSIWNFSPTNISSPENVRVQNTSLYSNLALLLNKHKDNNK